MKKDQLGIGIVGSGFNARFHLHAFVGVRDVARPICGFGFRIWDAGFVQFQNSPEKLHLAARLTG